MQRVDRQGSSDAEKAYSLSMMQELKIGNQIKESTSGPITAPPKNKWNRVLYGPAESKQSISQDHS